MDETGVPLRAEARPARAGVLHDPFVILQVFGNGQVIGRELGHFLVDPLHEAPAVGQIVGRFVVVAVDVADVGGSIPTQAVNLVLVQPRQGVIAQHLAHFGSAIVGPRVAPGRLGAVVVIEVDAAAVALRPAVEAPQVKVARPQVVIDHVEDDGDAMTVSRFDELLEAQHAAVIRLHGEWQRQVIAPGAAAGELHRRHDLHGVDAHLAQVG